MRASLSRRMRVSVSPQIDALNFASSRSNKIEALAVHEADQRAAASQLENEMRESQQLRTGGSATAELSRRNKRYRRRTRAPAKRGAGVAAADRRRGRAMRERKKRT